MTAGPMLGINARLLEQLNVLPRGVLAAPALAAIREQSNLLAVHAGFGAQLQDLLPKLTRHGSYTPPSCHPLRSWRVSCPPPPRSRTSWPPTPCLPPGGMA